MENETMKTDPNDKAAYLSKREYFAAMAMQGMLANPNITVSAPMDGFPSAYLIEKAATYYADSLIKELNKEYP